MQQNQVKNILLSKHTHANDLNNLEIIIPSIIQILDGSSYSTAVLYEDVFLENQPLSNRTPKHRKNLMDQIKKALDIWVKAGVMTKEPWKAVQENLSAKSKMYYEELANNNGSKGDFYTIEKKVLDAFIEKIKRMKDKSNFPDLYDNSDEELFDKEIVVKTINEVVKKLPTSILHKNEDIECTLNDIERNLAFTSSEKKLYDIFENTNDTLEYEVLITSYKQEAISQQEKLFNEVYQDENLDTSLKNSLLKTIKQYKEFIEASNPTDLCKANFLFWFLVLNNNVQKF